MSFDDDDDKMSMGEYEEGFGAECDPPDTRAHWENWQPETGLPGPGLWRVRDGAVLKIAEMTDRHLQNVALFERKGGGEHPKIQELRDELARRKT